MTPGEPSQGEETPWWQDASAARREYGTAPLGDAPPDDAGQAPALDDLEATRPLSAAHSPGEEQIELGEVGQEQSDQVPTLFAAALRDVGQVRQINQDHVYTFVSTLPRAESDLLLGLFVVADGMGGHDAGEVASQIAIGAVARHVLADLVMPALEESFGAALQETITEAVRRANQAIWDYGRSAGMDLGTTCTAALVLGRTIYIGHVGDSRAYLLEHGELRQLTTDHSAVGRLIQLGQLDATEAREHPLRSQLYRTVGQMPDVHVDLVQRPLGAATHLLICSDGLWGMVEDSQLAEAVRTAPSPQAACQALIDMANAAGGEDNISAVVVQLADPRA